MTVNAISKEEKIKMVLELVKKYKFTAKEIAEFTGKNRSQIHNILKGNTTNPQNSTLNAMLDFLEAKILGIALPGHENFRPDLLNEPGVPYKKEAENTDLMTKYLKLTEDYNKLLLQSNEDIRVIGRLKLLLEKHNIDYSHITEE